MTYWALGRDFDGKTYVGIITGNDAHRVHRWINIDASLPNTLEIFNIPVISFSLHSDGPVSTQPLWCMAKLDCRKFMRKDRSGITRFALLNINQDGGQGDPWAYMAHSWNRLGAPNLIHFPMQMPYPQQYSMVLNATLIQASRLGPPTAQKIRKRLDRNEDGNQDGDEDGNNNNGGPPKALRNSADHEKGDPKGPGGRGGQVAT